MCIYLYCFLLLSVKILLRNNEKKNTEYEMEVCGKK